MGPVGAVVAAGEMHRSRIVRDREIVLILDRDGDGKGEILDRTRWGVHHEVGSRRRRGRAWSWSRGWRRSRSGGWGWRGGWGRSSTRSRSWSRRTNATPNFISANVRYKAIGSWIAILIICHPDSCTHVNHG